MCPISNSKLYIIIPLMGLVLACVNRNKCLVGNSISGEVTIEEFIHMYIDAKCEGDKGILCLVYEPERLQYFLEDDSRCTDLEKDIKVCDLEIASIEKAGTETYQMYVVLFKKIDAGEIISYECQIVKKLQRYYVYIGIERLRKPSEML